MKFLDSFKEIKGDASYRKFYRNKKKKSIIVFANKEKNKNLLVYDAINKILIKNKIIAPKLLKQNFNKNFIEIEDLGKQTIYQMFKKNDKNHYHIFKNIIKILNKMQLIKDRKIKNFNNKIYKIQNYKNLVLLNEANLFNNWYAKKKLSPKKLGMFSDKFNKEIKFLLSKLKYKNDTFVHRDFHVSNIMINKKKLGLIDSQDAIIGNPLYDVASLIDDVRIKLPQDLQNKLFKFYWQGSKYKNKKEEKLKNDFDILSIQRNLKILGIFVRLCKRDNKSNY